jgi:hypothetical protein
MRSALSGEIREHIGAPPQEVCINHASAAGRSHTYTPGAT